jgi:EAL domain-containing protein (putative c-di-GMP-specific phosphodiesterase class I)
VEAATFAHDGRTLGISISIGAAGIDGRIDDVASVMTAADMACYTAKNTGRNRVVAASGDSARHRRDDRDAEYVTLVRRALADDRLTIYGQPIAPTGDDDGRLRLEVLVRVINEDGSVLEPARFISAAERFGLVRRIDEWVLRATLDQLTAQPAALERMELCMLNLSAHSIQDADFLDTAMWLIQRSEVPSTSLAFEITESAAISRLGSAQRFIAALAELGVRFAIDDFGEGFSSFRHLKQLDVDFIKIDGGIIRNIADDPIDRAMARSVHQLGNAMGLETIAEFVEGDAIMSAVREIGIDFAQGYGIGQPEPLADLTARAAAAGQPNASAG